MTLLCICLASRGAGLYFYIALSVILEGERALAGNGVDVYMDMVTSRRRL